MTTATREHSIGRCIYSTAEIGIAIERLAQAIAADYCGQPLLLLGVLKGALCFTSDLARGLAVRANGPSELMVDYLSVARYGGLGSDGGPASLLLEPSLPIGGANVLVADGIVDRGQTLAFLRTLLERRRPASLRICVLFEKQARREVDVRIDYCGLPVPNLFVIGYGLDYKEVYRNLPYLAELREGQTV